MHFSTFQKKFLLTLCNILLFMMLLSGCSIIGIILGVRYFYGNVDIALMIQHSQLIKTVDLSLYYKAIAIGGTICLFAAYCLYKYKIVGIPLLVIAFCGLLWPEINFASASDHSIYHKYYTIPKVVSQQGKKKNIIWISLESIEKLFTYTDVTKTENLIPQLTELQKNGTQIHGYNYVESMEPTIPSYVATNCGIPRNTTFISGNLLFGRIVGSHPYAVCMTDILKKYGYDTTFVMGGYIQDERADAFVRHHPFTSVVDRMVLREKKYAKYNEIIAGTNNITPDESVFRYAKDKIQELAKNDKPFFISVITANTHGPSFTHVEPNCEQKFGDTRDCFYCMDKTVSDFVKWVQKQPFYKDTIVVLIGDHPLFRRHFRDLNWINKNKAEKYGAGETYNLVLDGSKNEPQTIYKPFTQVDWAPTILESAGFSIEPRRLGLGVSLWSNEPTLVEQFGSIEKFTEELKRSEPSFNNFFYGREDVYN